MTELLLEFEKFQGLIISLLGNGSVNKPSLLYNKTLLVYNNCCDLIVKVFEKYVKVEILHQKKIGLPMQPNPRNKSEEKRLEPYETILQFKSGLK